MKLPAFQFYPADWRKDPGVQALSYHDRGVWFEILCLMHESEYRGRLLLNGKPMPNEALARLLGLDKQNLTKTLTTLLDYGVASRDDQGALVSRRMVRDEEVRQIRSDAGKKGGNPALLNQNVSKAQPKHEDELNQKSTPSSSSSSSSSDKKKTQEGSLLVATSAASGGSAVGRRIWTDGLDLLTQSGIKTANARSLLGKLAKDYGNERLAEAIAVTQAKNPVNAEEFLVGVLKERSNGTHLNGNAGKFGRKRTDQEALAESADFYANYPG